MIKLLLALSLLILTNVTYAGTCTSISRSNYSANSVLTSSALNLDFNTVYGAYNAIDGGCVTDGTLEFSALSAADFASITSGVHQGCTLAYSDTNTISVGKCIATVNGFSIKTTAANTVTWGCSGCSSEVSSTQYYVYIKTGSTGTTLNLLISTTAPGVDGYDGSNNKVIGRFFNNASSAINQYSVQSWSTGSYSVSDGKVFGPGATSAIEHFTFSFGATATTNCTTGTCAYLNEIGSSAVSSVVFSSTGIFNVNFARTYSEVACTYNGYNSVGAQYLASGLPARCENCSALSLIFANLSGTNVNAYATVTCDGY